MKDTLNTGHWKYGRNLTMVDFVSDRTLETYMASENLAAERGYLVLQYSRAIIVYSQ